MDGDDVGGFRLRREWKGEHARALVIPDADGAEGDDTLFDRHCFDGEAELGGDAGAEIGHIAPGAGAGAKVGFDVEFGVFAGFAAVLAFAGADVENVGVGNNVALGREADGEGSDWNGSHCYSLRVLTGEARSCSRVRSGRPKMRNSCHSRGRRRKAGMREMRATRAAMTKR